MEEQRIVVFLLEGVRTARDALGTEKAVTIGGTKFRAVLPVEDSWHSFLAAPPADSGDGAPTSRWPSLTPGTWGRIASDPVIESVGLILDGAVIPPGDEYVEFDHSAAQWRQFLRDWLAVAAEGPTDWAEHYYGATAFAGPGYDGDYDGLDVPYQPIQRGHRHPPRRLSARVWGHALGHASAGDQPPLARTLMTTAVQAAMDANWRAAIIDASTAVEVALTGGMDARLSAEASPRVIKELIDATRMLGPRLDLAKKLGMPLPAGIKENLVQRRNAVVHQGAQATSAEAKAAILVAWDIVREYNPLPACCHEPESPQGA